MSDTNYISTIVIDGKTVNVYLDDCGQCYTIEWEEDGVTRYESCGTYNTDYEGYIKMRFDREYALNYMRKLGFKLRSDEKK